MIRRWGWSSLISQAGLTLGLSVVVARNFPEFGEGFRSLLELQNTLLTPHLGHVTEETYRIFYAHALEDVQAYHAGKLLHVLSPEQHARGSGSVHRAEPKARALRSES